MFTWCETCAFCPPPFCLYHIISRNFSAGIHIYDIMTSVYERNRLSTSLRHHHPPFCPAHFSFFVRLYLIPEDGTAWEGSTEAKSERDRGMRWYNRYAFRVKFSIFEMNFAATCQTLYCVHIKSNKVEKAVLIFIRMGGWNGKQWRRTRRRFEKTDNCLINRSRIKGKHWRIARSHDDFL